MKKLIIAVMLVAFAFSVAYAADVVTYESKKGNVTFDHKAHSASNDCAVCHEGTPAKIEVNKKAAHGATCKGCHKKQSGPTKCNACHKK
ncbi:MAG: cytochrome c family protein [Desulfuromonadales bacterium]|nr:cytochrome c family protein [Desulfuromonadales bacterium]